jgi:hypothetical protein
VTWTKYDDPDTTAPIVSESDPILKPGLSSEWDHLLVRYPSVIEMSDGTLIMVYMSATASNNANAMLGLAFSQDGFEWTRCECNPIFKQAQIPSASDVGAPRLAYFKNVFYVFMEVLGGTGSTSNIWGLRHEGAIEP